MNKAKLLFIVPAYNESGNIGGLIDEIKGLPLEAEILVVNDGSDDETAVTAREKGVSVISLPFNVGVGGAVQTGLKYALRQDFDQIVRVDGDGQHDPACAGNLLDLLHKDMADVVIGSRFLPPHRGFRSSRLRRFGINFFSRLIGWLIGMKVTDPTSGFFAYNRKAVEEFAGEYPQDFPEPEAIVIARRSRLRIAEVPVRMRARREGHSSIRFLVALYYMLKVTTAILINMLRTRKKGT